MNTKKIIVLHALCWTAFLAYFFVGMFLRHASAQFVYLNISMSFIQFVQFYICYLWIYPKYLKRNKAPQLLFGVLLALVVFITLRYVIEEMLFPAFLGFRNYDAGTSIWTYVLDNTYYGTSYIVISAAVWSIQNAFAAEKINKQLKEEAVKAELSFLKSQINPHFLYNTLNYIYALALPVSDQLAAAVMRLSDLMRYTLTESPDGKVNLISEVDYLESYIELFRMRFQPNFYVQFDTDGVTEQQRIASLLLIPFVENAFKHGVLNKSDHPVEIFLHIKGKQLHFEVSNTINNHQKDKSSGIGLINIQRRLDLIYPEKHQLDIVKNGDTFKTTLKIHL